MAQKCLNKSPSSLGNPGEESIVTKQASSVSEGQDLFVERSFDIGDTTAACESSFRRNMKRLALCSDTKCLYCPDDSSTNVSEDSVLGSGNAPVDLSNRRNALNEFLITFGVLCA